ncbi:AprI/Inh family metalloprotease inhibitor [Azorhizobium doebereinerae]|uniref:AprI/Inh family metalloprotease inhibitor n=1 Tax=Azorhizobium doebereinerae TaxID=281091 RepID=UPI000405F23E|nr:AprI/Inh family metalloprotease inhibitor [Azorhizobium doebereinerae]
MLRAVRIAATLLPLLAGIARAEEPKVLNLDELDPQEVKDLLGVWIIKDQRGRKQCRVVLKREPTIGGMQIDVDPKCPKVFPVMGDITAWRLMEGWEIRLADGERKTRIRFFTPDNRYVAEPETDGIFTIDQGPRR